MAVLILNRLTLDYAVSAVKNSCTVLAATTSATSTSKLGSVHLLLETLHLGGDSFEVRYVVKLFKNDNTRKSSDHFNLLEAVEAYNTYAAELED